MYYRNVLSACAVIAATACLAAPAMATPTVFDITVGGTGFPAPANPPGYYAQVQLTQDGSNVDVLVVPAPNVGFVDTGSHQAFDFYLATPGSPPTPFSSVGITVNTAGWTVKNTLNSGLYTANSYQSGFAKTFNFALDCTGTGGACGTGGSAPDKGSLSFTVDNVVIADFLPTPDGGFYFGADICTLVNVDGGCSGQTGPVASNTPGTPGNIPEPLTLSLFGAGLAGVAAMRRRKKA